MNTFHILVSIMWAKTDLAVISNKSSDERQPSKFLPAFPKFVDLVHCDSQQHNITVKISIDSKLYNKSNSKQTKTTFLIIYNMS